MTVDEVIKRLEMQEQILQFSHFTNEDAWELGHFITTEAKRRQTPALVQIELNNGYRAYQVGMSGTTLYHQERVKRKINTVKNTEKSSLHFGMILQKAEETLADWQFDGKEYSISGGGFPIRIEEVGVIGTIAVAGLGHVADHDLLINCISRYLHVDEIPRISGKYI